jgi:predicted acetyltransferase
MVATSLLSTDSVTFMSYEIRPLTSDDVPAFRAAIYSTFGHDMDPDDEDGAARFNAVFELDRMYPAFDGDTIVGTGGDFQLDMTVPGGNQVRTSGLTIISVRPTHTRQGVLTAMMREHHDRAMERGEPLGGLWASEAPIYSRFGYGASADMKDVKLDARHAGRGGREGGVAVRLLEADEAAQLLPKIYSAIQPTRPGMFKRSDNWWTYRLLADPEKNRGGASALRHAVAEIDGEPVGYVTYRQKSSWELLSEGEIQIRELMPATDAGYRALWHYAVSIDLFPIVRYWSNPVDDPLSFLMRDGRARETKVSDSLWTRLIDVPAALAERTYATDGSLTLGVSDSFCDWNDGTYRMTVDEGTAKCERVATESDVAMDVSTLGALYLGGRDAMSLARAGLIDGSPEAVHQLNAMFRGSPAPWCPEIF